MVRNIYLPFEATSKYYIFSIVDFFIFYRTYINDDQVLDKEITNIRYFI
jgi:hypothetical protein